MEFDVDVSGDDIFSKNYTIVIANSFIRGFKFDEQTIRILRAGHGEGKMGKENIGMGNRNKIEYILKLGFIALSSIICLKI